MTLYTMNGHRHQDAGLQDEIMTGILGNRIAKLRRTQQRMRPLPERFDCLDSPEPRVQLQEALKQIGVLMNRNSELLETVALLFQVLRNSNVLRFRSLPLAKNNRDMPALSHGFSDGMDQD